MRAVVYTTYLDPVAIVDVSDDDWSALYAKRRIKVRLSEPYPDAAEPGATVFKDPAIEVWGERVRHDGYETLMLFTDARVPDAPSESVAVLTHQDAMLVRDAMRAIRFAVGLGRSAFPASATLHDDVVRISSLVSALMQMRMEGSAKALMARDHLASAIARIPFAKAP